jgi:hypothetical protein
MGGLAGLISDFFNSISTQTLFAAGEEVIYNNRDGAMVR